MNEPLGEFGGVVLRKLILFQDELPVGYKLSPELLGDVSLRHRKALQGAGLVKYYSEPEGAAVDFSDESQPEGTKATVVTNSPSNRKRGGRKKSSRSTKKSASK